MVFVPPKDRVMETSISNSQTVFALAGAIDASFNRFNASMAVGDTTLGAIVEPGVAFKSGLLTYSATNQITVDSTGYESKGTFSSGGTKEVFMGLPAKSAFETPTTQTLMSGTTYTPTNSRVKWIEYWAVGAGGGSGGSGSGFQTGGGTGGDTTFNGVTSKGGVGGVAGPEGINTGAATPAAGGRGGAGGTGTALRRVSGSPGDSGGAGLAGVYNGPGGNGGSSAGFGAGGIGGNGGSGISPSVGGVCGGGAGGADGVGGRAGAGGGGGGEVAYGILPAGSYSFAIGAGGQAGALGTGGIAGATGGFGCVFIVEHYGS